MEEYFNYCSSYSRDSGSQDSDFRLATLIWVVNAADLRKQTNKPEQSETDLDHDGEILEIELGRTERI